MKIIKLLSIFIFFISFNINAQQLSVQTGHSSTILDLEFSPDGNLLVSSGSDNKILIWDLRATRQMNILSGHNGPISKICFHPKKKIIASASDDKTVRLWEYPSGKLIKTYSFFTSEVKSLDFRSDGLELACASDSIYIIDLKSNKYKTINKKARRLFYTVEYNKAGDKIIFGGRKEFKIYVYDTEKEKFVKDFRIHSNEIKLNEDDRFIYSAGQKGSIKRVPLNKLSVRRKFNLPAERSWHSFYSIDYSRKLLFGANKNGMIYVYNRNTGKLKDILKAHEAQVKTLKVSPDGKFLASAGEDKRILIWDINKNRIVKILEGGTGSINSVSFSEDGKKIFIAYNNTDFRIWDLEKKGEIAFAECPRPSFIERNTNKDYFVSNSTDEINNNKLLVKTGLKKTDRRTDHFLKTTENLYIYNPDNSSESILLKSPKNTDFQSFLISDSSTLVIFKNKSTHSQKYSVLNHERIRDREEVFNTSVYLYDLSVIKKSKKIRINPFKNKSPIKIKGDLYFKSLSSDGKSLIVLTNERKGRSACKVFNLINKNKVLEIDFNTMYKSAGFSPKQNYLYFISDLKDSILLYNTTGSSFFKSFKGSGPIIFSKDEKYCIYTDKEKYLHVYDLKNDKQIFKVFTDHLTSISSIKFNSIYKYIATAGHDGLIKFWDFDTGENMVSLAAFNETDYVYVSKDNYYYSTMGSMDYINFMLNERLYSFEQFDVKYNRPDIVLAKLPYSTNSEIQAYKKAYHKRIKKMGFNTELDEVEFNIPNVTIDNLNDFQIFTLSDSINLKISAEDEKFNLDRINIWINDVPLFDINGINISNYNLQKYTTLQSIKLSPGKNKIQVSANNIKGYESLRETFYIDFETKEGLPDLYLVSIGVSKHLASEYDLEYAAKDAGDVSEIFKMNKKTYNKIHTLEILDKEVTLDNIFKAKEFLKKSNINDVVVIFFAGHGMLDNEMDYYLSTYAINFSEPSKKGLEYEKLEGLLNGIPARKKILLIDACHSGEVDTDDDNKKVIIDESEGLGKKTRSYTPNREDDPLIINQSSFELMKHMFADIRKGTGTTIISSAGAAEFAYESDKMQNGIFTYILLYGINSNDADLNKDGDIMVSELRDYLMDNVSKLTKGYQNPTCRRINIEFDFKIW